MTKTQMIIAGINEFAASNSNKFTVKQVAEHFNVSEDTARKTLRVIDGLAPQREGATMFWSFVGTTRRVIKTSPEARNHKIQRYFRAACYNAAKLGLTQKEMKQRLAGWMDEYEVMTGGELKIAA